MKAIGCKRGRRGKSGAHRSRVGSMLAVSTISSLILVLIGLASFWLIGVIGGHREVQNATDAGVLNIAKEALQHPGVTLRPGIESSLFSAFANKKKEITLISFNKVQGAALLVGLNAQEIKTTRALDGARLVCNAVNNETSGLGKRLTQSLIKNQFAKEDFLLKSKGTVNSLRMLTLSHGKNEMLTDELNYGTGWLNKNTASNTQIDLKQFKSIKVADTETVSGKTFLKGYRPITLAVDLTYTFVPLFPASQPHMVSTSGFIKTSSPFTNIPCNAFKGQGKALVKAGSTAINAKVTACAIAGPLNVQEAPSLPNDFLIFANPPGLGGVSHFPISHNVFNTQLNNNAGVVVALNANGQPVAFSTNHHAFDAWIAFNAGGGNQQAGAGDAGAGGAAANAGAQAPGEPPIDNSGGQIFDSQGNPLSASAANTMKQITQVSAPLFWDTKSPLFDQMLPAIQAAYPATVTLTPSGGGQQLIALEKLKLDIINLFNQLGGKAAGGGGSIPVPPKTGLQAFDHDGCYVNQIPFSHPGTPLQLIQQIANPHPHYAAQNAQTMAIAQAAAAGVWDSGWPLNMAQQDAIFHIKIKPDPRNVKFVETVIARVKQIKPEATDAEVKAALNSQPLKMGSTLFLYMINPDGNRKLILSETPPASFSLVTGGIKNAPDGDALPPFFVDYLALFREIDCPADGGGHPVTMLNAPHMFGQPQAIKARDSMTFTPSSGANGCLGLLEFEHQAAPGMKPGTATFWSTPN